MIKCHLLDKSEFGGIGFYVWFAFLDYSTTLVSLLFSLCRDRKFSSNYRLSEVRACIILWCCDFASQSGSSPGTVAC